MTGLDLILRERRQRPNETPARVAREKMRVWALRWRRYLAAADYELAADALVCALGWRSLTEETK